MPNITLVFFMFMFFMIDFISGNFCFILSSNSFSYGISLPIINFAISSDFGFCIMHFSIGITSCVLSANTPIIGSPFLFIPTGYCALFL